MSDKKTLSSRLFRPLTVIFSLCLLVVLAACQPSPAPDSTIPTNEGDNPITRPDLVGLIEWDRSPNTVIFRAQQTGGDVNDLLRLGDVPDCTIYGDNSMVFLLPSAEIGTIVAVDSVPDEAIRTFVEDLTLNFQLFNQATGLGGNSDPSVLPPVYETLHISINGQSFTFDSLGGWESSYYTSVVERCRAVSVAAAEFAPEGGAWISVKTITYDPDQPAVIWDAIATGLDLAALADRERQWVTGADVVALWDVLRWGNAGIQFQQNGQTFQAALQVPGITYNSPPAP